MSDLGKLIKRMNIRRKYIILLLLRAPFDALRTWMLANLMKTVFFCLETEAGAAGQRVNGNVSGLLFPILIPREILMRFFASKFETASAKRSILCSFCVHNITVRGKAVNSNVSGSLLKICVVYGLISILLFVYNGTIWSIYAAFSARAEAWIQKAMLEKLLGLPLRRIDSRFSGEWITKLNSDIQAAIIMMNGSMNMPHLVVAVINTILSSFLMLRCGLIFLGVTWIFVLAQLFLNYKLVLEPVPKLKEEAQSALSESTSAIRPLITDADSILIYGAEDMMLKNCDKNSRKLMRIHMKMHVRKALNDAGMRLLGIGGYLVIMLLGYGFIYSGTMAFSDVVYCFQVRGSIIAGTFMLITCLNNLKVNSVCVKRINDTLNE